METEVKLTKLASCAGCGAKVGAGTLVHLLEGFRTHSDPRLLVGYDRSDDASVYYLDENTALVQTTDFFPPIVDDPFLYGQIAAANEMCIRDRRESGCCRWPSDASRSCPGSAGSCGPRPCRCRCQ